MARSQLLQHRLKTNLIGRTGSVQPRGKFINTRGFQSGDQTLKAIAGWTDGANCTGGGYVVNFNKAVSFTDHTGVSFIKNKTEGLVVTTCPNIDAACNSIAPAWEATDIIQDGGILMFSSGSTASKAHTFVQGTEYTVKITTESNLEGNISIAGGTAVPVGLDNDVLREFLVTAGASGGLLFTATSSNGGVIDYFEALIPESFDEKVSAPIDVTENVGTDPSPTDVIIYDVNWATPVVAGDVITWLYDGGNYRFVEAGEDDVPMEAQELTLTNCLDPSTF